jgi:tripartite-type tricarboxylate transporter receptor subunit TctC
MKHAVVVAAGVLMTFAVSGVQAAEGNYPNRPVRFIAPFVPGGPSDILSRLMSAKLTESMGQQFVVDNRGGAGGIVGIELGAKAPPDGYTLLLSANSLLTINPHVYKKIPYDPVRDFQPITQLTQGGNVVVVHPSVAAKNIKEFIALAKAKPGAINYATTGTGNLLGIANFSEGRRARHGAHRLQGNQAGSDRACFGEVQFFFMNPLVAIPNVKGGKLRGLAVTGLTRNPALPDIPTVDESGVKGFKNITWHSVLVPAKTPKPIVTRLNAELVKIVNSPDVKERFLGQGLTPVGSTPEQLSALIRKNRPSTKLVKEIKYEPQ